MRIKGFAQPLVIVIVIVVLTTIIGGGIVALKVLSHREEAPSQQNQDRQVDLKPANPEASPTKKPDPTAEMIVMPKSAMCGKISQTGLRDADYAKVLKTPCKLSLLQENDEKFLELKHYLSSGPNMSDVILVTFDVSGLVDSSRIVSSNVHLENMFLQ